MFVKTVREVPHRVFGPDGDTIDRVMVTIEDVCLDGVTLNGVEVYESDFNANGVWRRLADAPFDLW